MALADTSRTLQQALDRFTSGGARAGQRKSDTRAATKGAAANVVGPGDGGLPPLEPLEPRVLLSTVFWNGDVNTQWDTTTANWYYDGSGNYPGATFANGDTAVFDAAIETRTTVDITDVVEPADVRVQWFSNDFVFRGGDIGGTGGILIENAGGAVFDGYTTSLSFAGDVRVRGDQALLHWKPAASGTISLGGGDIYLEGGDGSEGGGPMQFRYQPTGTSTLGNPNVYLSGLVELHSNPYADWSQTTLHLSGTLDLTNTNGAWEQRNTFNGLNVQLTSDNAKLWFGNHYNDAYTSRFNGVVHGPTQIFEVQTEGFSNGESVIYGPGNWDVLGLRKTGSTTLRVETTGVFGDVLRIDQGKIDPGGLTHNVKDLWLGGVQQTQPGTYGATGSGADYIFDNYFQGTGVVKLLDLPNVSLTTVDGEVIEEDASDSATLRFTRDDTVGDLLVNYSFTGTAGTSDINETLSGTITIPDGQASADLVLTAVDDADFEDVYEVFNFTLDSGSDYRRDASQVEGTVTISDGDLPSGNTMLFEINPMTAGISGFRAAWDQTNPDALEFDAIHRSLLVRFPGVAEKIQQMIQSGHEISQVELILPYRDTEVLPDGYYYSSSHGETDRWQAEDPNWHAIGWGLLQPWTADGEIGPTYNAYINGAGFWDLYGAQDETADRGPVQFAPTEVSSYSPEGRLDITAMLTDPAFGATLGERITNLEESGALVKKWEGWDAHYAQRDGYQWGIETGGHAIEINPPKLEITFADTATPPDVSDMPAPVDVHALATTLNDGAPTAVIPTQAEFDAILAEHGLQAQPWMTAWQADRLQELMDAHDNADGPASTVYYRVPDTLSEYEAWVDDILRTPWRRWQGHSTTRLALDYLQYKDALPAPVVEHLRNYWEAYIQPDRPTSEFVHPQSSEAIGWDTWQLGDDWRGNSSFFRDGYVLDISTLNFNHTAVAGAILGSAVLDRLDSQAYTDGRRGLESWYVNHWGWGNASSQEELDHYYLAVTQFQQLALRTFAPDAVDRFMADRALLKSLEITSGTYHPELHRFINTSARTSEDQIFVGQDGLYSTLHTLSQNGVLRDLTTTLPDGYYHLGHDIQPGQIARLFNEGEFAEDWFTNLVEKPLPHLSQAYKADVKNWITSYLGQRYGMASLESSDSETRRFMAQWRQTDTGVPSMYDITTMFATFGLNQSKFMEGTGGIQPHRGGELATIQSKNKAFVFGSPNQNFSGYNYNPPSSVNSIQTALGLFQFDSPTWSVYLNGVDITADLATGVTASLGDRITIQDGPSYAAIIPLAANSLGTRDQVVRLSLGDPQRVSDRNAYATPYLMAELFNYKSSTAIDTSAVGWDAIRNSYGAFIVELSDDTEHASFADFQAHIDAATFNADWNADVKALNVNYTSGGDSFDGRFVPANAGDRSAVPFKRYNGEDIINPPAGVDRDTSLTQIGYLGNSRGLTLQKNGATLELGGWRRGYLQTDPVSGTYAGHHVRSTLTPFELTTPEGPSVKANGSVTLASVAIQPGTNTVWVDWAVENEHKPDLADAFHAIGFASEPTVYVNGTQLTSPLETTTTASGETACVIPLVIENAKPRISVNATDASAAEQNSDPATFTISRDDTAGELTVYYTVGGSATDGDDYTASPSLTGSFTFSDGQAAYDLTITPIDDSLTEGDETVTLTLSDNSGYWLVSNDRSATATIVENDVTTVVDIEAVDPDASERNADPGTFVITRSQTDGPATVYYTVSGTATGGGVDYQETLSGQVAFADGQAEATITITPIDNSNNDGLRDVVLTLSSDPAYQLGDSTSASVVIFDNEINPRDLKWAATTDSNWDTSTANWSGDASVFREGDNVKFGGSPGNSDPTIVIEDDGVFADHVDVTDYSTHWYFSGGPLRGEGGLSVGLGTRVHFRNYTESLSFSGGISGDGFIYWEPATSEPIQLGTGPINLSGGGFHLLPSQPFTLNNELIFGSGSRGIQLVGNDNADWGGRPVTLNGTHLDLPPSTTFDYDNLVLDLKSNATLDLEASYHDSFSRFNGQFIGDGTLTIVGTGGGNSTIARTQIRGPGHWRIGGLVLDHDRHVEIYAPQIAGDTLSVYSNGDWKPFLADGAHQTVSELWLGGVQMTTPGTYGGVESAAEFLTPHLAGTGYITLVPADTTVSIEATDATAKEGEDGATFTVTRNNTVGHLTVYYNISGTADGDDLAQNLSGHVTIDDGETSAQINIDAIADGLIEGDETLTLTIDPDATYAISGSGDATVTVTENPVIEQGVVTAGTDTWTTVQLDGDYTSPVVIATPNYGAGTPPLASQVRNAGGNSFELRLARFDGQTGSVTNIPVHYLVVEEGVYTEDVHGVNMEAVRFTSTVTAYKNGWTGETRSYANSYTSPVVLGQVMSANDADPSVFWAAGATNTEPPSSDTLRVGKHVGEDPDTTRADETIGYLVIEAGSGSIGNLDFTAAVGADTIDGYDARGDRYALSGLSDVSTAVVSGAGMDGGDGYWPVLYGSEAVTAGWLDLAADEDKLGDTERGHTTEQVAYLAFGELARTPDAAKLAKGVITGVTDTWQTVQLRNSYDSMVVVATPNYGAGSPPLVTRIRNATGDSFEIKVQRVDGLTDPVSGVDVHYTVVEEGVYTEATHGFKMEAISFDADITDHNGSWTGDRRAYLNSYTSPVVLGQVMSHNDPDFSTFWSRGDYNYTPADADTLYVGKHVGEDPDRTRATETIGYIVLEAGPGSIEGIDFTAGVGADTVHGFADTPPYSYSLTGIDGIESAVVSSAAMEGTNGGWAMLYGDSPVDNLQLDLAIDEDTIQDTERNHIDEQVAYIAFETVTPPTFEQGVVTGVTDSWQTVSLGNTYNSMVVATTPVYGDADPPLVTRIRNVTGSSFEIKVQRTDGLTDPVSGIDVHYMAVEEGVYNLADHGVKMEAVKFTSTVTDENDAWVGEARTYGNSYTSPVVLGQVMSHNDAGFSAFWSRGAAQTEIPDASTLYVGKHVGQDSDTTRADETLGYIVFEAGAGAIGDTDFVVGVGADTIKGHDDTPPFTYAIDGLQSVSSAIATLTAMDGGDGGWAYFHGSSPVSTTGLDLAIDEDQLFDTERNHTDEQVAYVVFGLVGSALHAEGGESSTMIGQTIDASHVAALQSEAVDRWRDAGYDVSALASVSIEVVDLDGSLLGLYRNGRILIDDDAAGLGWFVDRTPDDDVEFHGRRGPAGYDLLTTIMHEQGHALGLADQDPDDEIVDVMDATLTAGDRRNPQALNTDTDTAPGRSGAWLETASASFPLRGPVAGVHPAMPADTATFLAQLLADDHDVDLFGHEDDEEADDRRIAHVSLLTSGGR